MERGKTSDQLSELTIIAEGKEAEKRERRHDCLSGILSRSSGPSLQAHGSDKTAGNHEVWKFPI